MKQNLLIGNGINLNTVSNNLDFYPDNIEHRFYNELNNVKYTEEEQELKTHLDRWLKIKTNKSKNIEQIANDVYCYIENHILNKENFTNSNNDIRLKKILIKASINAIFLNNKKFINIEIIDSIKNQLSKYENIYTLNYHEYWDEFDKVEYLHGNIEINNTMDTYVIDSTSCIFSTKLGKEKSKESAVYPCDTLLPSTDLHPNGEKKLYEELIGLDMIDIFGVSPSDDEELMAKIKKIDKKTIYIHKMNKNEILKWKKYVGKAIFLDSTEFIKGGIINE